MATEKAETDRVPVTLALSTIGYLEKLVRQGTHGTSVPGVARTLIEEGRAREAELRIEDLAGGFMLGNALRLMMDARLVGE